jgi:hypothetical protein
LCSGTVITRPSTNLHPVTSAAALSGARRSTANRPARGEHFCDHILAGLRAGFAGGQSSFQPGLMARWRAMVAVISMHPSRLFLLLL